MKIARKMAKLAGVVGLAALGFYATPKSEAWPFPTHCVIVDCADGCSVPESPKCATLAADQFDNGDVTACFNGSDPGYCYP